MEPERRCYKRKKFNAFIDYSSEKKAESKNISIGGICILIDHHISEGTILFLVIPLKKMGIIQVIGEVIWSKKVSDKKYEAGIEFLSLNDFSKDKISSYIEE
ncbi:MAG: PilZ domain-containing protein [Spirochaetales bacterium]|nr:PilZ domain-containing protein [Spirochaetales bacterium]